MLFLSWLSFQDILAQPPPQGASLSRPLFTLGRHAASRAAALKSSAGITSGFQEVCAAHNSRAGDVRDDDGTSHGNFVVVDAIARSAASSVRPQDALEHNSRFHGPRRNLAGKFFFALGGRVIHRGNFAAAVLRKFRDSQNAEVLRAPGDRASFMNSLFMQGVIDRIATLDLSTSQPDDVRSIILRAALRRLPLKARAFNLDHKLDEDIQRVLGPLALTCPRCSVDPWIQGNPVLVHPAPTIDLENFTLSVPPSARISP